MSIEYIIFGILAILQKNAYASAASVRYQSRSIKIENELVLRDIRPIYEDEYQKKCIDNICEMPDFYYPKEIITGLLKMPGSLFETLFNNSRESFDIELQSRTSGQEEENICRSIDRRRYPIIMRNTNNHWKYVVNVENYTPSFLTSTCDQSEMNYCNKIFHSKCQQLYTKINLMTYENKKLDYDIFWIKNGCKCSCQ